MKTPVKRLKNWFLERFYANHSRTPVIKEKLAQVLGSLPPDGFALNVGAGGTRLHPQVRNLDIAPGDGVDYVVDAADGIPLPDGAVDLVISQEVLEHVRDPSAVMLEIARVLRPGGCLYLQLPFVIGYHPGPFDFWRFTKEGVVELTERAGLEVRETGRSVGPATGYYRISVEFWATLLGARSRRLYLVWKGLAALGLYPIKYLDRFMIDAAQADRIAGGYFVVAQKPGVTQR